MYLNFRNNVSISMHLVSVIRCTIIAPTGQHSVARDNTPGIANDNHKPQRGGIYVSITITSVSPFDFLDEKPGGVAESRNPQRTPRLHRWNRERTKRGIASGRIGRGSHPLVTYPSTNNISGKIGAGNQNRILEVDKNKGCPIYQIRMANRLRYFLDKPLAPTGCCEIHRKPSGASPK